MRACDRCLRRAHLIGLLAPRIAGLLDRPGARARGLLALSDEDLVAAVAGRRAGDVRDELQGFDAAAERRRLAAVPVFAACPHGEGYPDRLSDLTDPPAALFSTSDHFWSGGPTVAIVGTRAASPYGLEVAHALGRGLGAARVPVVSGLALGIDAAAHRGCLDAGGRTIAVLAGGVDVPYPRQNRRLYQRILSSGAVISEMPPGQRPFRWSFPARNRIMAGLAEMTVIVEAADPSGSLITAEFARDIGRAVGAVPGRITARIAVGTNALLRDGAIPVTGVEDVLDELFGVGVRPAMAPAPTTPSEAPALVAAPGVPIAPGEPTVPAAPDLPTAPGEVTAPAAERGVSIAPDEVAAPAASRDVAAPTAPGELGDRRLREVLEGVEGGRAPGEIVAATGASAAEVRGALARLEGLGLISRAGLGSYERVVDG